MKIAIYGDSWASEYLDKPHSYLGWPEILAQKYTVDNFSVPGSSLYFSYTEFLKNHKNYDVNIFLITSFGRLFVKSIPASSKTANHVPNLLSVINRKRQLDKNLGTSKQLMTIYDAVEQYFLHIQNDEYDELVDKALVHHAKSLSTNTIFIPCFHGYDEFSFIDVYKMENDALGFNEHFTAKNIHVNEVHNGRILTDIRVCHLTKRNNEILAEKLISAIEENNMSFMFSLNDFVSPTEKLYECFAWLKV